MKRLEKISVLTAKLKKAVAEEGIGGLAGRTKGYLARAKKEKEFQSQTGKEYSEKLDFVRYDAASSHLLNSFPSSSI